MIAVEVVPELDAVYRTEFPTFYALGIPLHVTLSYPFVAPDELGEAMPRLQAVLTGHARFAFTLTELRTFPRTVWLAPEPSVPFVELAEAIEREFPERPYWGGVFEMVPHLTLTDGIEETQLDATFERLRPLVEPLLPVTVAADEVVVLVEQEDGRMPIVARLPLGQAALDE